MNPKNNSSSPQDRNLPDTSKKKKKKIQELVVMLSLLLIQVKTDSHHF
jgi:hypothetical protein